MPLALRKRTGGWLMTCHEPGSISTGVPVVVTEIDVDASVELGHAHVGLVPLARVVRVGFQEPERVLHALGADRLLVAAEVLTAQPTVSGLGLDLPVLVVVVHRKGDPGVAGRVLPEFDGKFIGDVGELGGLRLLAAALARAAGLGRLGGSFFGRGEGGVERRHVALVGHQATLRGLRRPAARPLRIVPAAS
jgi:hypothetical protein